MGHGKLQKQQEIAELEALAAANDANAQFRHGKLTAFFGIELCYMRINRLPRQKLGVEYHAHKHNVTILFWSIQRHMDMMDMCSGTV